MAKDDIGHIANGSEVNAGNQLEKGLEGDAVGSSTQDTFEGCSSKKTGKEKIHLRTLMLSRSAETVGRVGGDSKLTGQRPDRLHARRPSTSRRGCAAEHNPFALRFASSKAPCRNSKTSNIRTSKSCTKECEIVRADYTNDYSTAYSTFYEDIFRPTEESDTFTGFGEDGQGSDNDYVTLSESTSLIIDNGDVEVGSDSTVVSRGCESCSLHSDNVAQSSTDSHGRDPERPGACRCGPKIDSSDEHLDSDASDRQQGKRPATVCERHTLEIFIKSWSKENHTRTPKICSGEHQDLELSSSEHSNARLQKTKAKGALMTSPSSAESSPNLESSSCNDQSHLTQVSQVVNKDVSYPQPTASVLALKDNGADVMPRDMNTTSSGSYISRLALDYGGKNTKHSLPKYEDWQVMKQLEHLVLSQSSSRVSLYPSRATLSSQCISEKEHACFQNSHQGRPKTGSEKRTPYPEELANAVTEAINAGEFHLSQILTVNQDAIECLLEENPVSKASLSNAKIDKYTESNSKTHTKDLSEKATEKPTYDSPGISILSFNVIRDISDNVMPGRRDHNDVILGDDLTQGRALSRVDTPLSTTSELHTRINIQTAQKGSNANSSPRSPHNASAPPTVLETPPTCTEIHDENNDLSSFCMYPCIVECPKLPNEFSLQNARLAVESLQARALLKSRNEIENAGDSCSTAANKDLDSSNTMLKLQETTGLSPGDAKADGTMNAPSSRSAVKGMIKSSVLPLGSHEYLTFLNKLRQEKPAKQETNRQQKVNKSQRKVAENEKETSGSHEDEKKTSGPHEDDSHGGENSLAARPICPVGHEVPADWKPGEHTSHPLTKLIANYAPGRKVKKRRSIRRKKRLHNRQIQLKKEKEVVALEINRHVSNCEVNVNSPPNPLEASKSCSTINEHKPGSRDTDGNPEDDVLASFEYKRRYYERLNKLVKDDSGSDSKSDNSPIPKRVTSQVKLLKTLDELYSSDSSDEAEGELPFTDRMSFDVNHQTSLFNYYTTRLKHMSVLGNISQQGELADTKMPYIRIRRVEQEVPSALDHKRLKSLYECRLKKPALTSKIRKMDHFEQTRGRYNEKSDGVVKSGRQVHSAKGYGRAACRTHNVPQMSNSKVQGRDMLTDTDESDHFKERIVSLDKTKGTQATNTQHRSYLDILKSNTNQPCLDKIKVTDEHSSEVDNINSSKQKALRSESAGVKESPRPCIDEHVQKTPPPKEREFTQRARMKVRFADPYQENKERVPYEMSEEDTWCSTVNAMLLRANRVMDDVSRNDHRYPKPDSARVVSPVPPKSPTFLKELLKQDTIERKQARGYTRLERRYKESFIKQDRPDARSSRPPNPVEAVEAQGSSHLTVSSKSQAGYTQNNSSLVYSVPSKDGGEQACVNEKSAGVLKISIQMSKQAQERAWLTHERIKRQRAANAEIEMKSEMKTLPKKLTPLRISKPINFQNPDSRNLERIPMRDVLSKTLMGMGTSSQQIFQPKASVADSSTAKGSNFLLDHHSETLRYFRGPYMHQRSSSIVPLFSDSNNNAYLKGDAEKDTPFEDNLDANGRPKESHHVNQDVFANVHANDTIINPENHDGRLSGEEQTSYNRHETQGSQHCHIDAVQSNDYCCNTCSRQKDQQSTENKSEYHQGSEVPQVPDTSLTSGHSLRHSKSSNRLSDTETHSSKSFPDKNPPPINADDNLMSTASDDTQLLASLSKYISVTIKPKETNEKKIQTPKDSIVTSNSAAHIANRRNDQKVYISGMRCFENIENDRNLMKANWNSDDMEYKRSIENGQMEKIEEQLEIQETLLDALLGYEIERMSKAPLRMADPDDKQSQSVCADTERLNGTSATSVFVDDVSELCSTCYLNQWLPNYQDTAQETENLLSIVHPKEDQQGCQMRGNQVDVRDTSVLPCEPTGDDIDSTGFTQHLQGISFQHDPLDTAAETPEIRQNLPSQRLAPRPKRSTLTDKTHFFDNFAILGSTISLTEKRTQQISTGTGTHKRLASGQKTLSPSQNQQSLVVRENQDQGFKSRRESDTCISSVVGVKLVGKPVTKMTVVPQEEVTNGGNKYHLKQPLTAIRGDITKQQATQKPVKTMKNLKITSTQKPISNAGASAHIDVEEDVSMNKTYCGNFDWASVKIPPSFTKFEYVPSYSDSQQNVSRMEISKKYSTSSIYSTTTPVPNLEDKTADAIDAEEASNCLHTPSVTEVMTPNILDSNWDPPNSLCTTSNLKDVTSSMSTRLARCSRASYLQNNEKDKMDYSNTHQTTVPVCENMSTGSRTSDVENECPTLSHTRISPSSLDGVDTTSQLSEWFYEELNAEPAVLKATYDTLSCRSDTEQAVGKLAADGWEFKEWHAARQNLKLQTAYVDTSVRVPLRQTRSTDSDRRGAMNPSSELPGTECPKTSELLGRDFLKTLRNTDLLHTVSTDRRRLLRSLQLMIRRHGYLPMFRLRSKQVIEMMPQIVVLNHCAKTFIERGSSSFSGTVRCLPIFYTEDNTGFLTSIYTVNWIPEGVYSLEKSTMEAGNAGELRTSDCERVSFGKLLQYSPFASDLAFSNDQAFLIGDEVNSREEAAKTLIAAHDEAQGDVAKYFMLMCGWMPPHMNQASTLPTREAAIERNSDITESKEIDSSNIRKIGEEGQFVRHEIHLPAISVPTDYVHSVNNYSKVRRPDDQEPNLPDIGHAQLVARSENPAVVSEAHVSKVCKLPDICKSPGGAAPDTDRPAVMLCLRCGVKVDCAQALTDEVTQHTDEMLSFPKWPAVRTYPAEPHLRTSPERLSCKRADRTSCRHSWEVTDGGLALPLVTATTCKSPSRFRAVKERSVPLHTAIFRKRLNRWLNRITKSQTAFPTKNEFELSYTTLPRVRSQIDMHTPRGFFNYIDTPVISIDQIQEYTHSNVQSVEREAPPWSTAKNARQSPGIQAQIIADKGNNLIIADKGNNLITEFKGNNLIIADKRNTLITADKGKKLVTVDTGNNLISADRGNNLISADRGNNLISADRGNNLITADRGNNIIKADKGKNLLEQSVKFGSYSIDSNTKTVTQINDSNQRQRQKSPASTQKPPVSANNQKGLKQQTPFVRQTPVKPQAPLRQLGLIKQNQQSKETSQQTASNMEKDKGRETDRPVAGWSWNTAREAADEEQDLMVKRTWSQVVIPPPFPVSTTAKPALKKISQKSNNSRLKSSKAHLAKHRRNLNQINQSYISPYWAKKEIKRARSKTPVSDSGDDRSSISRITTISGMSSSSSESNAEEESSTEESEDGSRSSASGSDFFTRYANKGGPTSVDDIFKRTLPRQKLDLKLARLKEAKEKEEVEQLGYLRGREGATPPPQDHGDNVKNNDHAVSFALSEYDMCSDAEEVKELWKQCFPEIDFWDTKRRKKFKKTKILS